MNQVTIKNDCISITVLDYGAIIQKIELRDKHSELVNIAVGFENPKDYLQDTIFLGACVGRYAGRISKGGFKLNGTHYPIHHINGVHLHGGVKGFGKRYWTIDSVSQGSEPSVSLSYTSASMEEGYPGELKVKVIYKLVGNSLHIIHRATTTETTVINLTNHSYFHLDGEGTIDHYHLQLNSDAMVETHENLLPTGNIIPIHELPYDFRSIKEIGGISLDTPYVLKSNTEIAASIYSPISGISMKVSTNQPALVVYRPPTFPAICFETQNYPDAPNYPHFPSAVLHPGETYDNSSVFEFDLVN
ncbi:MAG: aldose epimerase family protein [Flavobacteriaceae bacterium]